MKVRIATLAVALMFSACGGGSSSPTVPAAPNPPAPPTSSTRTEWRVTQRFVSVEGPDNCWVREQRARLTGLVFPDLPMSVSRSQGSITLESGFFQVNYGGTVSGLEFSADGAGPLEGGGMNCQGGSFQQRPGVSRISGRFTADDQLLTATEVNSYLLTSGEPITYTWDWQATRRN
jgi:hypothetical protein